MEFMIQVFKCYLMCFYLSKSSSANHLQGLKVLQTQSGAFQAKKLCLFPCMLRTSNTFLQSRDTTVTIEYSILCDAHFTLSGCGRMWCAFVMISNPLKHTRNLTCCDCSLKALLPLRLLPHCVSPSISFKKLYIIICSN